MLSPGLISYQRSMRTASRQPSSFKLPSMTIGPLARVMAYVSPRVDVCAEADGGIPAIAAVTAALKMPRADISSLRRDIAIGSFDRDKWYAGRVADARSVFRASGARVRG